MVTNVGWENREKLALNWHMDEALTKRMRSFKVNGDAYTNVTGKLCVDMVVF